MAPSPAVSGEGSVSVQLLTPTTICSPRLDAAQPLRVALDEAPLHVVDGRHRAAHGLDALRARPWPAAFSSSTLRAITVEPSKMSPYSSRSVS